MTPFAAEACRRPPYPKNDGERETFFLLACLPPFSPGFANFAH